MRNPLRPVLRALPFLPEVTLRAPLKNCRVNVKDQELQEGAWGLPHIMESVRIYLVLLVVFVREGEDT